MYVGIKITFTGLSKISIDVTNSYYDYYEDSSFRELILYH